MTSTFLYPFCKVNKKGNSICNLELKFLNKVTLTVTFRSKSKKVIWIVTLKVIFC